LNPVQNDISGLIVVNLSFVGVMVTGERTKDFVLVGIVENSKQKKENKNAP
jgi:hypothetical protein